MSNLVEKLIIVPVLLIVGVYICYSLVTTMVASTPGFGDAGWYIFGAIVLAIGTFFTYSWLKG